MKLCGIFSVFIVAAAAVALWLPPSSGQDAVFTAPATPPAPAATPELPASPVEVQAVLAAPVALPGEGGAIGRSVTTPDGGFIYFAQAQLAGGDEATRKPHAEDQTLEHSTRQLIEDLRKAESAGDRSPVLEKLTQTIEQQFDIRQQIRAKELEALEARVKKLRELHEKRERAKDDIVEERVNQIVREADGLGWSSGGEHGAFTFAPGRDPFVQPVPAAPPRAITISPHP
jgi:hypothetical protein